MKKTVILFLFLAMFSASALAGQIRTIPTDVTLKFDGKRQVEEAVFEATYVINPEALKALVLEAKTEVKDLGKTKGETNVNLNIPANYLVKAMAMYEEVDLCTNTVVLYQLYEEERIELLKFRVATGRPGMNTPLGNFCIKRVTYLPHYYPPKEWGGNTAPVKPGRKNPYGYWMSEILKFSTEPAGYEFGPQGKLSKNGVNQHSTNKPGSIGRYASHACVRIHPDVAARLFPFFLHFTPHQNPRDVYRGKEVMPFKKGHLIYVKIYRSKKK